MTNLNPQEFADLKDKIEVAKTNPATTSGHRSILNTILHALAFLIPLVEHLFHTPTGVSSVVGGQAANVDSDSKDTTGIEGAGTTVVDGAKAAE